MKQEDVTLEISTFDPDATVHAFQTIGEAVMAPGVDFRGLISMVESGEATGSMGTDKLLKLLRLVLVIQEEAEQQVNEAFAEKSTDDGDTVSGLAESDL